MQARTQIPHEHKAHTVSAAAAHSSPKPQHTTHVQQDYQCGMKSQQSPYSSSHVDGGERHPECVTDVLYIRTARDWENGSTSIC